MVLFKAQIARWDQTSRRLTFAAVYTAVISKPSTHYFALKIHASPGLLNIHHSTKSLPLTQTSQRYLSLTFVRRSTALPVFSAVVSTSVCFSNLCSKNFRYPLLSLILCSRFGIFLRTSCNLPLAFAAIRFCNLCSSIFL